MEEKKFYRVRDVMAEFCVARSTIWRWCKNGIFPKPRRFGQDGKLIGWCAEDIEGFKESIKNVSA
ncbi:AlpA family transcriptional regulator [Desulfobotulus alkaliphilus]|uniref:AlpA family transcriptional regulator n=1 Tax=Desulfobotulus alkaliphilus TaxID=622671 RepID=A0A562RHL6_9BACT|nr:AlpA family phage regulatory protein [Desulfobotulus alkaliphilus]TWI68508.1 AlpA family transcriptional regulator [Desulfobotulus alkaliphilus]